MTSINGSAVSAIPTLNPILDFENDDHMFDRSVLNSEYIRIEPLQTLNFNNSGTIEFRTSTDGIYLPSQSYLHIEGTIVNQNGNVNFKPQTATGPNGGGTDVISLVNNAMMFLFNSIRLSLGNVQIEQLNNPGQTTTMINHLRNSSLYDMSSSDVVASDGATGALCAAGNPGLNACWSIDSSTFKNINQFLPLVAAGDTPRYNPQFNKGLFTRMNYCFNDMTNNQNGYFAFDVPLNAMFGFCEYYDKVVNGLEIKMELNRTNDAQVFDKSLGATPNGSGSAMALANILKMQWWIPRITIAPGISLPYPRTIKYYKYIDANTNYTPSQQFTWTGINLGNSGRPRWMVFGFQLGFIANGSNSTCSNYATFGQGLVVQNVDVQSIQLQCNGLMYPAQMFSNSWRGNAPTFTQQYRTLLDFRRDMYGCDNVLTTPEITFNRQSFAGIHQLFLVDLRSMPANSQTVASAYFQFNTVPSSPGTIYAAIIAETAIHINENYQVLTNLNPIDQKTVINQ